jgi:hypothetical protein
MLRRQPLVRYRHRPAILSRPPPPATRRTLALRGTPREGQTGVVGRILSHIWLSIGIAAVAVIVLGVGVLAIMVFWAHQAERYTSGLSPAQFYRQLDPDLLDDYSNVYGVAHNSGDDLRTTRQALKHGADVIEIDVISVGGELYAGHDSPIRWIGARFFRGPALEDVWNASAEAEFVKLDIKNNATGVVDRVIAFVNARPERPVMVSTRSTATLEAFAERAPHVIRLLSVPSASRFASLQGEDATLAIIDGVSMRHTLYTEETAAWLEARGYIAMAWTVNDGPRLNELVRLGVDVITTDNLAIMELLGGQQRGEGVLTRR